MQVDFLSDWTEQPFAKLAGNTSVHQPEQMMRGWNAVDGLEASVGARSLIDAGLLELLATYRRAVCRILCQGTDHRGVSGSWSGTGFLVGPNLLLTNHHVLNSIATAAEASVDFEYERSRDQLSGAAAAGYGPRRELRLDPERLFVTSPAVGGLDYTFVRIAADLAAPYGHIPMSRGSFTGRRHEPVFLLHHPNGDLKQASVDDTEILNIDADLLLYAADTNAGSSGAPVITRNGKLCALHHAYRTREQMDIWHADRVAELIDGGSYDVANEGIKISAIAIDLETQLNSRGPNHAAISEVLSNFIDTDTLTGPFGVLGRQPRTESNRADSGTTRVAEAINATEQDLDIAVWNMEWLNAQHNDDAVRKRIATVFADLTHDAWVLNGISPEAAMALRNTLRDSFGQEYECIHAEDEIHPAQPSISIIYNSRSLSITRAPWPAEVEALWRLRAGRDIGLESLHGPVFPSFPARFELNILRRQVPTRLFLLPLFVGERINAMLRRAVAARLLEVIVEMMGPHVEADQDWLIVGDTNTPLRDARLDALRRHDFAPLIAFDRARGGMTYLAGRNRIMSHIFIPRGMETIGNDSGHVTTVARAFEGEFIDSVTGATPFGLRISLQDPAIAKDLARIERYLSSRHQDARTGGRSFESADSWIWEGLGKAEFIRRNLRALHHAIDMANDHPGPDDLALSLHDFVVLIYCEAGFRNGAMDPQAHHSLGERGLLPLPDNLSFWIGANMPRHDTLLPIARNITLYAQYLAKVKNRNVRQSSAGMLYRDLFRAPQIAMDPNRSAALLAGIIHGYFVDRNFANGRAPDPLWILAGYADDMPVQDILRGSGYVHENSAILQNRQANINLALQLMQAIGPVAQSG
ncbi:serine protease [Paracoccus sp. Z330]|uniref:Serine protease n=1 Tax=Paracoccus onchidii TaxID=3017813 RepID=A0ABT4ZH73_9RHOB|nr:serine protease [Paracoccus onchidii]MDB6178709.1 serine protease [Paracoccus onchidii]